MIADPTLLSARWREALAGTGIEAAAGEEAIVDAAAAGRRLDDGGDRRQRRVCARSWPRFGRRKTVALANKESLVSAGDVMIAAARESGARLLPVDSEHNAIFQCFDRDAPERVRRIILTASGGPFRDASSRRCAR